MKSKDYIIFSYHNKLLLEIYPKAIPFVKPHTNISQVTEHGLFEVSFCYKHQFYNRLRLSKLYINNFLSVIEFFDIQTDGSKLKSTSFFKPIFIFLIIQIKQIHLFPFIMYLPLFQFII